MRTQDSDAEGTDWDSDSDAEDLVFVLDSFAQDSVLDLDSEGVDSTRASKSLRAPVPEKNHGWKKK